MWKITGGVPAMDSLPRKFESASLGGGLGKEQAWVEGFETASTEATA